MTEIFGIILEIRGRPGTVIFVLVLGFLVMLEFMFAYLQKLSDRHGYADIYDKLKKELMILGIISFTVFIYESIVDAHSNSWLVAFEMAHIIVLFMAISFIIQALMLVRYASVGGRQLIAAIRKTFSELKSKYLELDHHNDSLAYKTFHYLPSWIPIYPSFRFDIEYRIIEKFFLEQHPLPSGFRFSKYATILFKMYISELGDVGPMSWLLLAIFVVLNYIRIVTVDNYLKSSYCQPYHAEEVADNHHRYLSGGGGEGASDIHTFEESLHTGCLEYIMSYSLFCGWTLLVFVLVVFFTSNYYYDKLIRYCLKKDHIQKASGRHMFEAFLDQAQSQEMMYKNTKQSSMFDFSKNSITASHPTSMKRDKFGLSFGHISTIHDEAKSPSYLHQINGIISPTSQHQQQLHQHKEVSLGTTRCSIQHLGDLCATEDSQWSIHQYKAEMEHIKSKLEHEVEVMMNKPCYERIICYLHDAYDAIFVVDSDNSNDLPLPKARTRRVDSSKLYDIYDVENDDVTGRGGPKLEHYKDSKPISRIFLFKSPQLHFKVVEIGLLVQCFYISVWATQLLPLANHSSNKVWYIILLSIPIIATTILFMSILHRTVMLHTIVALNSEVVDIVCDQSIEEMNVITSIRRSIRERLHEKKIEQSMWRVYIRQQFDEFDLDNNGIMDRAEFRTFLGTLNIFMSKGRFDILWEAVDYDLSGAITWDELFILVFPEYLFDVKEEMRLLTLLQTQLKATLTSHKIPKSKWIQYLQTTFNRIDINVDDAIDTEEFCNLLEELGIDELNNKEMKMLYTAIDVNESGGISFFEFLKILHLQQDVDDTSSSGNNNIISAKGQEQPKGMFSWDILSHLQVTKQPSGSHDHVEGSASTSDRDSFEVKENHIVLV